MEMFASDRVARLERHLGLLGPTFGQDVIDAVTSSIRYWQRTLTRLSAIKPRSRVSMMQPVARSNRVPVSGIGGLADTPELLPSLLDALQLQSESWYDVLVGRRALNTFTPIDIMAALSEDVLTRADWRLKHILPLIGGLVLTIGVFGVMVALGVYVLYDHRLGPDASAITSLGTVITAAVTFLAGHLALLYQRGQRVARQVQLQAREVVSTADQRLQGVAQVVGQTGPETAHIASTVLNNLIRQIGAEVSAVALTGPLVTLALRRAAQESDNPLDAARNFLGLIADDRSNLDRMVSIFPELYMAVSVVS
jgi:hypothetical protein